MSAETDLNNILSQATFNAFTLAGASEALVSDAIAALNKTPTFNNPPSFNPESVGISNGGGPITTEPAPSFPAWLPLDLGHPPAIQTIDTVDQTISLTPTILSLPAFTYPAVSQWADFSGVAPVVDSTVTIPTLPATDTPKLPTFLALADVIAPTLALTQPTLAPITTTISFDPNTFSAAFTQFKSDIFNGAGGVPGLTGVINEVDQWADGVLGIHPDGVFLNLYLCFVQFFL